MGGPDGGTANSALVKLLKNTDNRWAAATAGSQQAASLELTSYKAVMAMGGFSGSDNSPTLAQFKQYVAKGEIHYLVAGGGMPGSGSGVGSGSTLPGGSAGSSAGSGMPSAPGGSGALPGGSGSFPGGSGSFPGGSGGGRTGGMFGGSNSNQISQIESWVKANYKQITVGGETVYDLTQPKS